MKKYFYIRNGQKQGPFSLEEMRTQCITPETMVWFAGLEEWTAARNVAELVPFLVAEPVSVCQPVNEAPSIEKPEKLVRPPRTWLAESILATLFCCLPLGIVGIVYAAKVENRFYSGDLEGAEMASREAKRWTLISFWVGLASIVITVLFYFLLIGGALMLEGYC